VILGVSTQLDYGRSTKRGEESDSGSHYMARALFIIITTVNPMKVRLQHHHR
jgi:hypothetical protein